MIDTQEKSAVQLFVEKLKQGAFSDEQIKAEESLHFLEHVIENENWIKTRDLLQLLQKALDTIENSLPWETTPINMVRRVMKLAKDEHHSLQQELKDPHQQQQTSTGNTISVFTQPTVVEKEVFDQEIAGLRDAVLEIIAEFSAEVEQSVDLIAAQGEATLHSDEVIMTCGRCPTVRAFLTAAAKRRRLHVIVAECAPAYEGHQLATELKAAGIQTTFILDSTVFSVMSRVNKVIIGTHTVLANGGLKTFVGAASLAQAAKFYSVPMYVCSATYKLSLATREEPSFPHGSEDENTSDSSNLLQKDETSVSKAQFDYVAPENVEMYITNNGGVAPSYVYRQLIELYDTARL